MDCIDYSFHSYQIY
ncbi:hypothetical protein PFFCH_00510 [Plasmodium falciparum FCH/4]|uniref:Uncharacterized protein n=1 Tax=Plasmodium falciparum FCH/4 TaxID=1036724 RepID=A0A024VTJ3_PLAFA|nr:hypothetical protein PFFCH_00510 [Plasmodium falciparum FCH/4]